MEKKAGNNTNFSSNFSQDELKKSQENIKNSNENKIVELEKTVEDLKSELIRSLAEIENLKKRQQKELETVSKFANSNILKDLMEPFEQLFMALAVKPSLELTQEPVFNSLFTGIEMTKSSFEKAFAKHKLKRIFPKGEKFDHNIHQAISQVQNTEFESGIVVEVVQAGYCLEDRVLKPALVIVAS